MSPSARPNNNQRQHHGHGNSLTRAPGMIQNRIAHSLRRRGVPTDNYSPINPCLKHAMFLINVFFLLVAAAVATMCIYILVEKKKKVESFVEFLFDPACLLCFASVSAFVVSFFGAYGALRENTCCLKTYHILLSILLLLEISVIIFTVIFYYQEETFADIGIFPEKAFEEAIEKYRDDPDMQDFIDNLQDVLSCCGASNSEEGYLDWNANRYFNCTPQNQSPERCSVPFSCCRINDGDQINYRCGAKMLDPLTTGRDDVIYTRGCLLALKLIIEDHIYIVAIVIPVAFIFQMFFISFSKALVAQIKEQKSKWV